MTTKPKDTYSAEPWSVFHIRDTIQIDPPGTTGERPAIVLWNGFDGNDLSAETNLANARRIVACVNACAGIPTDTLRFVKLGAKEAERQRVNLAESIRQSGLKQIEEIALLRAALQNFSQLDIAVNSPLWSIRKDWCEQARKALGEA